jgi:hypothetical protein
VVVTIVLSEGVSCFAFSSSRVSGLVFLFPCVVITIKQLALVLRRLAEGTVVFPSSCAFIFSSFLYLALRRHHHQAAFAR